MPTERFHMFLTGHKRRLEGMKQRSLIVIFLLFAACDVPETTQAGWQDFIKETMKVLGGGDLTESDIARGLKEALEIGTANAVRSVSKVDGYYRNPKISIPLPENVKKAEGILRAVGFGSKVDQFRLSMNRAAERAAPEAKSIFWGAIKEISFDDARKILNGRENEATLYFREKTSKRLGELFHPIVHQSMSEVGVTRSYQVLEQKVHSLPFAEMLTFDLDQYVTQKSLDGLFLMLAEEEKKIREDPAARVTDLLKKVFGRK